MSEAPNELRQLLAEGKRVHEPESARLDAVYQRVLRAPPITSEYDLPPSATKPLWSSWSWLAGAGGVGMCVAALWWLGSPTTSVPPVQVEAPEQAVEPIPAHQEPALSPSALAPPALEPPKPEVARIPSRDWPAASRVSRRSSRRAGAVQVEAAPQVVALPVAAPPVAAPAVALTTSPTPAETSDAEPLSEHGYTLSTRESQDAASLRDEVRWIARARTALAEGDWAAAQHALDEHLMAHPIGQLHVERRSLLLRARCMAGDLAAARRLHAELQSLAPGSSLLRSVERACPQLSP
jgi:hypothetical protein